MNHKALAIKAEGIGKLYRLDQFAARPNSFRDLLTQMATAPARRFRGLRGVSSAAEEFWALKDVSFSVQPGEVVGIVGRNGAGKSTLLKILSRIVEPTCGQIRMNGRVASLLEVGTGFHPELSGRENIYLNGSILGMRKTEIDARFDAIVEFAEIERFLDTPVKRYSSGMYVRLAFAVAAHLEPEILVVDEVLAVGDGEFQKKCIGKMKEVSATSGRTVLFVSHNMAAVRTLCTRGILLRSGRIDFVGSADEVVDRYLATTSDDMTAEAKLSKPSGATIWMSRARLLADGVQVSSCVMGAKLTIEVDFQTDLPTKHPRFGFVLETLEGEKLINANNRYQASPEYDAPVKGGSIVCDLGAPPLLPGRYLLTLRIGDTGWDQHVAAGALGFEVTERDLWGQGRIPPPLSHMWWPTTFQFRQASAAALAA